jgi:hypothetical protein
MKRTPLKTKSELKRTKPLKEGKPLGVNRRRRKERSVIAFGEGGRKAEFVRANGCVVHLRGVGVLRCEGKVEAHHVRTRGAGGTAADLVGLCALHHWRLHHIGRQSFDRMYGLELEKLATEYERRFQEEAE